MKHRIVELGNGYYAIQTKVLFWWFYWITTNSLDWHVSRFYELETAQDALKDAVYKPKKSIKRIAIETSTKEINK